MMHDFHDDEGRNMPVPLHCFEAEASVLGGLMIDPGAWLKVAGILGAQDFFRADHQKIFTAIKALADSDQPRDLVTVADWLYNRKQLDDVGGLQYLGNVVADTPTAANIVAYAAIVADKAARRVLIAKAGEIAQMAASSEALDVVLGQAQSAIFGMSNQGKSSGEPRLVTDIARDWIAELAQRYEHDGDVYGVSTGFDDLDAKLCGLQGGDMVVIAGRPGMGKTTLAMNIAEHAATRSGTPTLVFSLEMPAAQIMNRLAASMGEVSMSRLASPKQLDDDDFRRITSAILRAENKPLLIDDTGSLHINQVRARARIAHQKHGIGMIVIDYLGLMRGDGKDLYSQTTHISGQVKAMAKELDVPVIVLAQLNRGVEQRVNKRPVMADLRDSGAIEQDADKILAVYRDEAYNDDSAFKGIAEVEILKHRSGETGRVMLAFQGQFNRFRSLAKDWVPPQHALEQKKPRFEYA